MLRKIMSMLFTCLAYFGLDEFGTLHVYTHVQLMLSPPNGMFKIVAFIMIAGSRCLQISLLSSPTLMKRDFKTTSTSKRPDFSM
jgi:hypothetical protein